MVDAAAAAVVAVLDVAVVVVGLIVVGLIVISNHRQPARINPS